MQITKVKIYKFSIPMVPFTISSGTMSYAQNVLIKVETNEGVIGFGECSAFPMIVGETQGTCYELAKDFAKIWIDKNPLQINERLAELDAFICNNNTIKSAFDMALYDIAAKSQKMPLYKFLGGQYAEPESDLTIGIGPVDTMIETAKDFVVKGVNIIKVKLGKNPEADIFRMQAIRKAVGNNVKLRIDANQGWDYEGAVLALTGMRNLNIEFCEQPMHKNFDHKMPALKQLSDIAVMADESVFTHFDAERLIKNKACDSINIKVCKAGGINGALRLHNVCMENQIPNMLGGMLESRLALSAFVHLAISCKNIVYYDLDTCLLGHKVDPVINGVKFNGMKLQLPDMPGIGAVPDEEFLKNCESIEIHEK